ncbi:Shedu immune nuclease family protein [Actinomadura sp. NPDC048021]|uniref:Shedu immune nuclease family protein n=1 Tax=Actinomadura sp. NPDC048021 TaxID=3155385 RepID=UPI0033E70999
MARFGIDQSENGRLDIRMASIGQEIEAYFIPSVSPAEGAPAAARADAGVKLLGLVRGSGELRIYPINTLYGTSGYLGPKYDQIRTLVVEISAIDPYFEESELETVLEVLPAGFVKDYAYGLGLLKDCNRIIRLIEKHTACDEIAFTSADESAVEGRVFRLGMSRFAEMWSEIRRINDRGNRAAGRVKDAFVHNDLATVLGLVSMDFSLGRHPVSRVIAKAADGVEELNDQERDALIATLTSESAGLAKARPEKFQKLHREIELVSLDHLIASYEESLEKGENEQYWQTFFDDNAFALQQVFGAPMVSVQSQATVGGGSLAGGGDKIADYLFKNSLTNNVALVEIKKPTTRLLDTREHRTGVYGPSKELNGAVTQVLDQAYQLTSNLATLKHNSRRWDLESYAISCFVVAGRTPPPDEPSKQKSFELYRANSRSVTIVTYDEILERLRLLRNFLAPTDSGTAEG